MFFKEGNILFLSKSEFVLGTIEARLREEMFYLTMHSTHFNTVIWRQTYGKGPFIYTERKPTAATTCAIFF